MARLYWDATNNRPATNNPWFNAVAPHCYSWGSDFNHESSYTKKFVEDVTTFWLNEYKIDGFRFDFTKGFTNSAGTNCGWDYDASRVNILKQISDKIWNVKSNAYIILEHWADSKEESELGAYRNGMLPWRRVDHEYKEAISGNLLNETSFAAAQTDNWVVYMESHDEERIMVQNELYGAASGTYNIKYEPTALDRMALGSAFLYTVPGPKMIWMFGEQGYDVSIDYNGRTGEKPLLWQQHMADPNRVDLFNTTAELLKLRKDHKAFTEGFFTWTSNGPLRQIKITHADMDVVIIGNFGTTSASITPSFPRTGTWYNYFGKFAYTYNTGATYTLAPGQWELFTSKDLRNTIATPTNLAATVTGSNVSLSWTDNATTETGYQVERTTNGTYTVITTLAANTTAYTNTDVADGLYTYRVRATGASATYSAYSNEVQKQVGNLPSIKVNFKNTANWTSPKMYYWAVTPSAATTTWPGVTLTDTNGDGWLDYTLTNATAAKIIFSNNGASQTPDLTISSSEVWYEYGVGFVDPNQAPVITVDKAAGQYPAAISVKLTATDDASTPTIYYTTNNTTPTTSSASAVGTVTLNITATTTVRAIAYDNKSKPSAEFNATYTIGAVSGFTVHTQGYTHVYFWGVTPSGATTTWPGVAMTDTDGDGWKDYTFTNATFTNLIFSNNGSGQTANLTRTKEGWFRNGTWSDTKPVEPTGLTVHAYGYTHVYFWNVTPTAQTTTWPGVAMTSEGNGWYKYTLTGASCSNFIFTNNGSGQTADLTNICSEKWYKAGVLYDAIPKSGFAGSVASENELNSLMIYPSPVKTSATLQVKGSFGTFTGTMLDLSGKIVNKFNFSGSTYQLQRDNLKAGLYIIMLKNNDTGEIYKSKLVVD